MANFEINSIINNDSITTEIGDTIKPYTFIEFITKSSFDNTDDVFLTYYKEYLTEWSNIKNTNSAIIKTNELIQNEIIDLLKIITISYTTYDEQVFLSNLNWDFNNLTDPLEKLKAKNAVYSALPIFVSRIKDIATFYRNKRSEASFSIQRNKIKGSQLSVEKIIFDKLLTFLFNQESDQIAYVQNYLNITIDNYIDVYSDYFDIDRVNAQTCNYNDIKSSIYFELEVILRAMIFDGNVYLREIPLIAQLSIDLSQDCVGDKLILKNKLLAESKISLIDNNEKIALRKKLYEKYLGSDFYYLYKDETGLIQTDIFIKASNPSNNLLNQQTVDTPTTESKQLELLKNIGLFFKPNKTSILRVNTINFEYQIDEDKVESNKIYIFPDPKVYGNVSFNKQIDYPYLIEYSFNDYIKNFSNGWAKNDPSVSCLEQPIYSYYSKEQDLNKLNINHQVNFNFDKLYNKGFISTLKSDFVGNQFALYKEQNGKYAKDWDIIPYKPKIDEDPQFINVNGGILGEDDMDVLTEISADKVEWSPLHHYYRYFIEGGLSMINPRYFRAYIPNNANYGNGNLTYSVKDIESELGTAFIDGGSFDTDYNILPNHDTNGKIPKVLYTLEKYESTIVPDEFKPNYEDNKEKTYYDMKSTRGEIFVSIPSTQEVITIKDAFSWWVQSFDKEIYEYFVTNAVDIDIIEDIFVIKAIDPDDSSVHLLFEGIKFNIKTNKFEQKFKNKQSIFFHETNPSIKSTYLKAFNNETFKSIDPVFFEKNSNIFNKGSEVFYVEKLHKAYFTVMNVDIITKQVNNKDIQFPICFPDIFEIDLVNFNYKKYHFTQTDGQNLQQAESFRIPDTLFNTGAVMIQKMTTPSLTYSFDTNTFMLSYVIYDINNCPYVYKHFFKLSINGMNYYGEIDSNSLDSTVYSPAFTDQAAVISPGDKDITLSLNFTPNFIVS